MRALVITCSSIRDALYAAVGSGFAAASTAGMVPPERIIAADNIAAFSAIEFGANGALYIACARDAVRIMAHLLQPCKEAPQGVCKIVCAYGSVECAKYLAEHFENVPEYGLTPDTDIDFMVRMFRAMGLADAYSYNPISVLAALDDNNRNEIIEFINRGDFSPEYALYARKVLPECKISTRFILRWLKSKNDIEISDAALIFTLRREAPDLLDRVMCLRERNAGFRVFTARMAAGMAAGAAL